MFQAVERIVDDVKDSIGSGLRLSVLAAAAGVALLITSGFLTAALFVFVQQREGTVAACLSAAALFFIIALIAAGSYIAHQRKRERLLAEARRKAKAAAAAAAPPSIFSDPAMLAIGLQVVRTLGFKRVVPLVAVAGAVAAFFASQRGARNEPEADHLDGEA